MKRIVFSCCFLSLFLAGLPGAEMRPKIGLVLSGGGARGTAHIGVLKVLEEERIPIDFIVGTSMGAIVGGLYASGMTPQEIEDEFAGIEWQNLFTMGPLRKDKQVRQKEHDYRFAQDFEFGFKKEKIVVPSGLVGGQQLSFLLNSLTMPVSGLDRFDRFPIPFRAVATDIETGDMVVIASGRLPDAMRASMSVPGVFTPVKIGGRLLVDGGIVRNLPVDVAREMGADIVIAVNVGSPLTGRKDFKSMMAITMQVIDIMQKQNVNQQIASLHPDDILIQPNLEGVSSLDFSKAGSMIEAGEAAVRQTVERLRPLALSEADYMAYLVRHGGFYHQSVPIDFIRVEKTEFIPPALVERKITMKAGEPLDMDRLYNDVMRIYGTDNYLNIGFRLLQEDGRQGLFIQPLEKPWGPNYLRFGLNFFSDFRGSDGYNLCMDYTMRDRNYLGGELKTGLQLGTTNCARMEWYQPLDVPGYFFVAPGVEFMREFFDVYQDDAQVSKNVLRMGRVRLDVGAAMGTWGEWRVGVVRGSGDTGAVIGSQSTQKQNINEGALVGTLLIDTLDSVTFPHRGTALRTQYLLSREYFGADGDYERMTAQFMKAVSSGDHTLLWTLLFGSGMGGDIPLYDQFALGGFLRLSGYEHDQLRASNAGLARCIYYYPLTKYGPGIGKAIYLGGSIEAGSVWVNRDDFKIGNLHPGGTVFLGADTIFGPIFLGCGYTEGGKLNAYISFGSIF